METDFCKKSYLRKGVQKPLVVIISNSTAILHLSKHVPDCVPRHALDKSIRIHSYLELTGLYLSQRFSPGGGVLPYMGYAGMFGPKGYGFSAVLIINRVSNLADSGHK